MLLALPSPRPRFAAVDSTTHAHAHARPTPLPTNTRRTPVPLCKATPGPGPRLVESTSMQRTSQRQASRRVPEQSPLVLCPAPADSLVALARAACAGPVCHRGEEQTRQSSGPRSNGGPVRVSKCLGASTCASSACTRGQQTGALGEAAAMVRSRTPPPDETRRLVSSRRLEQQADGWGKPTGVSMSVCCIHALDC